MKKYCMFVVSVMAVVLFGACDTEGSSASSEFFKEIEMGFRNPDSMKLAVYWYWISDHISKEGVERDLESMKQVGINRVFIGNQGIDGLEYGKVKLFTPEWWDITHAALKKATELGIEIGMFNCPGWSQSGGPWVKEEQSMRYLASVNTMVRGPRENATIKLPKVADNAQDDVKIIAYPAIYEKRNSVKKKKKNGEKLTVDIPVSYDDSYNSLIINILNPSSVITDAILYAEENGYYRSLKEIHIDRSNPSTGVGFEPYAPIAISFPETKSSNFRLEFVERGAADMEIAVSSVPYIERYSEKSLAKMFQTPLPMWDEYMWEEQPEVDAECCIYPAKVIDLTSQVKDGILTWDVPEGEWTISRLAMRTTGQQNAPASPEGRGFEIDKMSKKHIAFHFDAFIGEILRRIPAEDRKTFKVVVEDSYETGSLNWTDDMLEVFQKKYGYDPTPYLPTLQGFAVGNRNLSDRFLWDLRRLVADRVAYDYVGGLREISNKHGLTTWLENYGHWGFPSEFLMYGGQSDEIGGEFWSEGSLGDIENRAASSCGHTYGKTKIWAESCTSGGPVFSRYPNIMKQRLDRFFTEGINSTLLHVYIGQPYEDREPGMAAWFGNEFNRKNVWFSHIDIFGEYLKRCNFMLQQGLYVADAAYFIGEDAPKMTGVCNPALPKGYSFDYINAEVLLTRATVQKGRLTLPDGMSYSLLVLPKQETMRPEVLRKIKEFVEAGLAILGPAPKYSPSLANYPQADKDIEAVATELWGNKNEKVRNIGQGKVYADGQTIEAVFADLGIKPDLFVAGNPQAPILFIHRVMSDGDIYFISNQGEEILDINVQFRTSGKIPELWNPLTDEIRDLEEFSVSDGFTTVPLQLQKWESSFIVFNKRGKPMSNPKRNFPDKKVVKAEFAPWQVAFEAGKRGPENPVRMAQLEDWTKSQDENLRYYSGKAYYKTNVRVEGIPADKEIYLDLGKVMVTAKVKLNGQEIGGVWTNPYRLNVSGLLKEGDNTLEVEVANNWMNRLIGDQRLPEKQRGTWTNVNPWKADSPLQSSGLLGPVEIQFY